MHRLFIISFLFFAYVLWGSQLKEIYILKMLISAYKSATSHRAVEDEGLQVIYDMFGPVIWQSANRHSYGYGTAGTVGPRRDCH